MKLRISAAILAASLACAQASTLTISFTGTVDGTQKTLTTSLTIPDGNTFAFFEFHRARMCPGIPVTASNPNGDSKPNPALSQEEAFACFVQAFGGWINSHFNAYLRERAADDAVRSAVPVQVK